MDDTARGGTRSQKKKGKRGKRKKADVSTSGEDSLYLKTSRTGSDLTKTTVETSESSTNINTTIVNKNTCDNFLHSDNYVSAVMNPQLNPQLNTTFNTSPVTSNQVPPNLFYMSTPQPTNASSLLQT